MILLIICILFILILLKQGHFLTCKDFPIYSHMFLSKIPFKAGDMLLFSNSSYKVINRTFGNNLYSHVGIIVEENGKFYSMELTNYPVKHPKLGTVGSINSKEQIYMDVYDRIENYSGQIYYRQLNSKINNNKLIEISKQKNKFNLLTNNCALFILNVLNESGVTSVKPNRLLFWQNMDKLVNHNMFSAPIKIVPDRLMIDDIRQNNKINTCF